MDTFIPTNTIANSALYDVLKMDDVVADPTIGVGNLTSVDLEESYMVECLNYCTESTEALINAKTILYRAISESQGDEYLITESFSDFMVKVRDIIAKFIKFIKSIFQRFITELMKIVGSDKYIVKHKGDFSKFKSSDEFESDVFKYSILPNVPVAEAILDDFVMSKGGLFSGMLGDDKNQVTSSSVATSKQNLMNELKNSYDRFRARVLGLADEAAISVEDFNEELFKIFRSGEDTTTKTTIDAGYVRQSLDRFTSYKKDEADIRKNITNIEKSYDRLKKELETFVRGNSTKNKSTINSLLPSGMEIGAAELSGELLINLDNYTNVKIEQIQEFSNIHVIAFGAKLDALKSCYLQDKKTLYTALSRVQRTDSKRSKND